MPSLEKQHEPVTTHYIAHVDYNIDERGGWGKYITLPQFQDEGHWEITPVQMDELALRTTILCLEDIAEEVRDPFGFNNMLDMKGGTIVPPDRHAAIKGIRATDLQYIGFNRAPLGPDPCQHVEVDILTAHAGLITIVRHPDFEGNNAEFHTLLHLMIRKFKAVRFAFETRANVTKAFRRQSIGS